MLKFFGLASYSFLQQSLHEFQPHRNVMILKRRFPVFLNGKGKQRRELKAKDFQYDLVEDTNLRKKEEIEVLLTNYVEGIGKPGELVKVKPNFAYEKLLLPKLAVYPTEENKLKFANNEVTVKQSSKWSQRTINVLSHRLVPILMNKDVPWVLEPWHIRVNLRKAGIICPEEAIEMPKKKIEGPSLDLEQKEFPIKITVNNTETVLVRCRLHLWSTTLDSRLPHLENFWLSPAEPLFPEDKEILDSMPGLFIKPSKAKK